MIAACVANASRRAAIVVGFLFALCASAVYGHGDVMRIGSTAAGGGRLEIEPGFDFNIDVVLAEVTTVGDMTLFSAIIPSFAWVLPGHPSLHPISPTATVAMKIEQIDAGASVRLKGRIIDAPNEAANIGVFSSDPEEHVHPEWRLILPSRVTGRYSVSFVLTTTTPGYQASPVYTLVLTNIAPLATATPTVPEIKTPDETASPPPTVTPSEPTISATPTAFPTAAPTAAETSTARPSPTPTAFVCAGDCNGDREVTVDELVRAVGIALGREPANRCSVADPNADGEITVDELVRAVNAALRGCS